MDEYYQLKVIFSLALASHYDAKDQTQTFTHAKHVLFY